MYKATLPLLLLLLVAGQMSAEFCMAQCEGMSTGMMAHTCGMDGMAQGHCPVCKHAQDRRTSNALSVPEICSGQICNSVLRLAQNRPDHGLKVVVTSVSIDLLVSPLQDGARAARFRSARSTKSILPFDPLISTLRI